MKCKLVCNFLLTVLLAGLPGLVMAAAISDFDSTQPRGANFEPGFQRYNEQGLDLSPAIDGFAAPQRVGDGATYREWAGMTMGNAARDPAFFATVNVANQDFLNMLYAAAAKGLDTYNPDLETLVGIGTAREVVCALKLYDPDFGNPCSPGGEIRLLPEDKLPLTADICLRCHTPVGWMEGHSEPETPHAPFLKGQFWGVSFLETPLDGSGNPRSADLTVESEAEMEGMQCEYCHRAKQNPAMKRQSRFDGSWMAAGGGSFFVDRYDTMRDRHHLRYGTIMPENNVTLFGQPGEKYICWSCHQWECGLFGCDIQAIRDCAVCHQRSTEKVAENPGYVPFCKEFDAGGNCLDARYDVEQERHFCGSCHDVTNPLIYTQTPGVDRMLHPIERTYTEWYWSDYRDQTACTDCHVPMQFQGAQTWLLYPGLNDMWGEVDLPWTQPPYNYPVNPSREQAYMDAMQRNREFMQQEAADIAIVNTPDSTQKDQPLTVNVKVTNKSGHKLPSGFAEGRQMWIHLAATDGSGATIFESGYMLPDGSLARKEYRENGATVPDPGKTMIKVYEQLVLAEGYKDFKLDGFSILDEDRDGTVSHKEEEFHFVLMNYIEKDNRIPPKGYNKAAYMKDGAFIVPHDPKDTDYPTGQNWDVTPYTFTIPANVTGTVRVTATLKYQTFNREYMEFLNEMDREPTESHGGRARDLPAGRYGSSPTWGNATYQMWLDNDNGRPVVITSAAKEVLVQ